MPTITFACLKPNMSFGIKFGNDLECKTQSKLSIKAFEYVCIVVE